MGCIRVDKIAEHLCDPLRKCLKDEDPYVRKTAAVCVAKLYDMNQQLVDDQGFLDLLRDLLSDGNGMVRFHFDRKARVVRSFALQVVANAVAALSEIAEKSPQLQIFELNSPMINKLLTALNECTEWGQIFLLDAIGNYVPKVARISDELLSNSNLSSRMRKKHRTSVNGSHHVSPTPIQQWCSRPSK